MAGFTPTPSYAVITAADALNHSVATPTGADEVLTNKDTNIAYCNFGAASTTSTFPVIAGQSIGVHFGGTASTIQCQSPTSTLNITISGGSGLFAGAGGGGSGGGGGGNVNVTQWDTTALGAPTAWGSAPSGNVIGANVNCLTGCSGGPVTNAGTSATTAAAVQGVTGGVPMPVSIGQSSAASIPISISTATTTQLVALSAGKQILVTSWDVIAGGTGNITLEYGTGSLCGTGTTALTGAYNLTAQTGIAKGDGLGTILIVPSGNALCALTSAAVQMSGSMSYTQQ